MTFETIKNISDLSLCTACGACAGVCPTGAISMIHNDFGLLFASIDSDKCINCKKCVKVCPSISMDSFLQKNIENPLIGNFINGYIGYALNDKIRQIGQSGGVVTACLAYLLNEKLIDGAYVNYFDQLYQKNRVRFAATEKKIIESAGSYYVQSAVCEEVLRNHNKTKVAVVTLGCQSQGFELSKMKPDYMLGLICAGQHSCRYYKRLKGNKVVSTFRFRDKGNSGWPGNIIYTYGSKQITVNKSKRFFYKEFYESHRCLLCFDQMNIFSDVVFGDPWGIDNKDLTKGLTVFITRTQKGEDLIQNAIEKSYIHAEKIRVEEIAKGQTVLDRHKNKFLIAKEYYSKNNLYFPYSSVCKQKTFNHKNKKFKKYIEKRLKFTLKICNASEFKVRILLLKKFLFLKLYTIILFPFRSLIKMGHRFF
jgi:coenzyme F420 hydrogenase subunit beta